MIIQVRYDYTPNYPEEHPHYLEQLPYAGVPKSWVSNHPSFEDAIGHLELSHYKPTRKGWVHNGELGITTVTFIDPPPADVLKLVAAQIVRLFGQHCHALSDVLGSADFCNIYELCQYARGEGSGDVPVDRIIVYVENQLKQTAIQEDQYVL